MFRYALLASFLVTMGSLAGAADALPESTRTWTDTTGTFKTEAVLLEFAQDKVRLRKTNGSQITVPLERLSPPDQQYVLGRLGPADGSVEIVVPLVPRDRVMGSLVRYHRPNSLKAGEVSPVKLKAEPVYRSKKPLYASFRLGDAEDNEVCLVLDDPENEAPRIFVDRNNDRDLTNDGDGAWDGEENGCYTLEDVPVQVRYQAGTILYTLCFYRWKERMPGQVAYYRNSAREGEIVVGSTRCRIAILEENADARFDDLADLSLLKDVDGTGVLVETEKDAFFVGDMKCRVGGASADGTKLLIRAVSVENEPKISVATTFREGIQASERPSGEMEGVVGWFKPIAVPLGETPPVPLKSQPAYRSKQPRYGSMKLGDSEDYHVVVVVDEPSDGIARIFVDRNNDRDLTNDGDGVWDEVGNNKTLALNIIVLDVHYRAGSEPYAVCLYRNPETMPDKAIFYRNSAREGEIELEGNKTKVLLLDEDGDGRFDDLGESLLLLDVNEDGQVTFDDVPKSHDRRNFLHKSFKCGGQCLQAVSISPDGKLLTFRRVTNRPEEVLEF